MSSRIHPAVERIRAEHGHSVIELLEAGLSGADLTSLLLHVAEQRASALSASDVLAQRERDRFVQPALVDGRHMMRTELRALDSIAELFDVLTLSPLCPLGTHSVVAGVHQNRVITTARSTEVAADPTNGLALEAALRRRDLMRASPRSAELVRLACVQRVTRAQHFSGPMSYAHFSLLAMVIAGRDIGSSTFERTALVALASQMATVVRVAGADATSVTFTDFDGRHAELLRDVAGTLAGNGIDVLSDHERAAGHGYYPSVCFKVHARFGESMIEVGDGGLVPWTQRLLGNSKERLLIGGIGLDRLAIHNTSVNPR